MDPIEFYYDEMADILWVGSTLDGTYSHTVDIGDTGVHIDLTEEGKIMGVEILAASKAIKKSALKKLKIPADGIESRKLMGIHYPERKP